MPSARNLAFARNFANFGDRCLYVLVVAILLTLASAAWAQQQHEAGAPNLIVSIQDLVREAKRNNPEIAAAQRGYEAATHVAGQASALPDTQLTVQQFAVGSPRPFAGYTNSDFAYIGLGASQAG